MIVSSLLGGTLVLVLLIFGLLSALAVGLELQTDLDGRIGECGDRNERNYQPLALFVEAEGHREKILGHFEVPELVFEHDGHILGVLGCSHITDVPDGLSAWEVIQDSPPDLLIVDWEMQPMDGIELVKKVRNDPHSPDRFMPIVMLTAHSERPRIITARDSGVNEFVMKPISAKTLFSRLNAALNTVQIAEELIKTYMKKAA